MFLSNCANMASKLSVVIFTGIICFSLNNIDILAQSESDCNLVEHTSDKCRSANYIKILGVDQNVYKGTEKRILLPGRQTQVRWLCGSSEERTAWNNPANQLRITYQHDGSIRWAVYDCKDLSGPKSAGLNCAVPETTEYCPKFGGVNSSACVFELKKSTSHVNQKTTTVTVTGTLRGEVEKEAGPLTATASAEVQTEVAHSVTKAKIVTYESRHFLVIPPGFSFCAYTNNTSVADGNAPTGFRWRCMFPEYVQAEERFSNGRCTSLEICEVGVCGRTGEETASGGNFVHIELTVAILFVVMALFRIY